MDKWIPVEERLPETVLTVIVTMLYGENRVVSFAWYSPKNKAWNLLDETYIWPRDPENFKILAWMQCPKEYEEAT